MTFVDVTVHFVTLFTEFGCDSSGLRTSYSSIQPLLIDNTHIAFSAVCELSSPAVMDMIYCDRDVWNTTNLKPSKCFDIFRRRTTRNGSGNVKLVLKYITIHFLIYPYIVFHYYPKEIPDNELDMFVLTIGPARFIL